MSYRPADEGGRETEFVPALFFMGGGFTPPGHLPDSLIGRLIPQMRDDPSSFQGCTLFTDAPPAH